MSATKKIMKGIRMGWILRMVLLSCGILLLLWLVLWGMRPVGRMREAVLLSLAILICAILIGLIIGVEQAAGTRRQIRKMGSDLDQCQMVRAGDGLYYGETWMAWHRKEKWTFWRRNQVNEVRIAAHDSSGSRAVVTVLSMHGRRTDTFRLNGTSMEVLAALQSWHA